MDQLQGQIAHLEEEANVCNSWIGGLTNLLDALKATIEEMKGQLCHCNEGKGKEVIKVESKPLVFRYDSNNSYQTAPGISKATVIKLIPIDSNPESREVMEEGD